MPLFPWIVFLGSLLLFQVQPIAAKGLLPQFGGAASVWTACVLFFQVALLGGYAYAHALTSLLGRKAQVRVHVALLGASVCLLPLALDAGGVAAGAGDPTWRILAFLARALGAPFVLVSATSPLLQAWNAGRVAGEKAYRLYALSNFGAILSLFAYPILVEPRFTTTEQAIGWSIAYGVFCVLLSMSILGFAREATSGQREEAPHAPRPGKAILCFWLAQSGCASMLLLAVTNQVCQEIAPIPFLWVLPLALYLMSLVICFESDRWYSRSRLMGLLFLGLPVMTFVICLGFVLGVRVSLVLICSGFFLCCMVCHGELARSRPAPRHLTLFYLTTAAGGALGGVFVGLIAPRVFRGIFEIGFALPACAALAVWAIVRSPSIPLASLRRRRSVVWASGMGIAIMGVLLWMHARGPTLTDVARDRNFYGSVRVYDYWSGEPRQEMRALVLGNTVHGLEYRTTGREREAVSYYGVRSGIALALRRHGAGEVRSVGVIGEGAGTMASFGRAGDEYTFYEINPLVEAAARDDFSYLRDSAARCTVVTGDARLSMEGEADRDFDVLVADAFSGDAIPMHLLTVEAFRLYFRHMKAGGGLAVNVSNRYVDLRPLLAGLARALGKEAVYVDSAADGPRGAVPAQWILVTSNREFLADAEVMRDSRRLAVAAGDPRPWTDQESSLFQALR